MSRPLAQMFASRETSTCRRVSTCIHGHVSIRTHQLPSSPPGHLLHMNSWHLNSWHLDTSTGLHLASTNTCHLHHLSYRPTIPAPAQQPQQLDNRHFHYHARPSTSCQVAARLASRRVDHCHTATTSTTLPTSPRASGRANANANARTQH